MSVTAYAVRLGWEHLGRRVIASMEDQALVLAAPRTGKSGWLADRVIDHPGAVMTTTTRTDLFENTGLLRGQHGVLHVFNPEGIGGLLSTFRWNPLEGCEQPAVALQRAASLTAATETTGMQDLAFWIGKPPRRSPASCTPPRWTTARWRTSTGGAHGIDDAVAEQILTAHRGAADGWLGPIREIRKPGRTADSIRMTVTRALAWLADPAVAAAVTPGPGEGFSVADFVSGRNTLYMIGTGREEAPIAPLFRAFAEYVHAGAAFTGSLQPRGRLDPPLLMALDEVTQICPVPLPNWMADSAGKGVLIVAVCHGLAQLDSRWDDPGARAIWDTAGVKVILGGVSDPDTLERLSLLCGEIALRTHSRTRDEYGRRGQTTTYEPVRVLPPELLATLPEWRALILRTNLSPVVVRLRMAWRGHDYQRARRNGAAQWQSVTTSAVGRRPPRWRSAGIDELTALAAGSQAWDRDEPEPQPHLTTEPTVQPTDPRTGNDQRAAEDAPPLPPRSAGARPPGRPRRPWDPPARPEDRQ